MADSATIPDDPERWLPIAGYDYYEVSNLGRVQSLPRLTSCGPRPGRVLKGTPSNGYLMVSLYQDGRMERHKIHRLVAAAFLDPCPPGHEVRHGPNGKLDNRASQLSYGTTAENAADRLRDGTQLHGEKVPTAKLTAADVATIRERRAAGETLAAIAADYPVQPPAIYKATRGESWRTVKGELPATTGYSRGEKHGSAKLTQADVEVIRRRGVAGETQAGIARDYGVSGSQIGCILRGESWAS